MRSSGRAGGTLLAAVVAAGCGTVRTVRVADRAPVVVAMSESEAEKVDRMVRHEPREGSEAACGYWRKRLVTLTVEDAGVREFAVQSMTGWCSRADAEAETARAQQAKKAEAEDEERRTARRNAIRKEEGARARKEHEVAEQEVRDHRCTEYRHGALQALLQDVKTVFVEGLREGANPEFFQLVSHRIVVATPAGASLDLDSAFGGELQLFAASYEPVRLDVRDTDGHALVVTAPYEVLVQNRGAHTDSRLLQGNRGDAVRVRVQGTGCTVLMIFRKH